MQSGLFSVPEPAAMAPYQVTMAAGSFTHLAGLSSVNLPLRDDPPEHDQFPSCAALAWSPAARYRDRAPRAGSIRRGFQADQGMRSVMARMGKPEMRDDGGRRLLRCAESTKAIAC